MVIPFFSPTGSAARQSRSADAHIHIERQRTIGTVVPIFREQGFVFFTVIMYLINESRMPGPLLSLKLS